MAGKSGKITLKPTRSRNTVRKTIPRTERLEGCVLVPNIEMIEAANNQRKTPKQKHELADAIYKRFITTDTEEQINISAKVTKGLKEYFEHHERGNGPDKELFEGVLKCISNNLKGTLQRFCVTAEYKAILSDFAIYTPRSKRPGAKKGNSGRFF